MNKVIFPFLFFLFSQKLFSQNVGIGTNSPQTSLHIIKNSGIDEVVRLQGEFPKLTFYHNEDQTASFHSGGCCFFIGTKQYKNLLFTINDQVKQSILSNGYIGMGTGNPLAPLHIIKNSGIDEIVRLQGEFPTLNFYHNENQTASLHSGGCCFFIAAKANKNIVFTINDQVRQIISSSGNVGIGTDEPTAKLQVQGFTKLGSDADAAPAIKIKEISGAISSSVDGGVVTIPHGLTRSKIIALNTILVYGAGDVLPGFRGTPGYEYNIAFDDVNIYIYNIAGNCSNILSKSIKISITHKE